ncbi:MAG: ADP-ribosylglycohydrolase family protein [Pseudomonadota bacterium]
MIGAIAGDIIGSVFESRPVKTTDFPLFSRHSRFTDDTVLTLAVAHAILRQTDYSAALKTFGARYPDAGYGMSFLNWIFAEQSEPYNSWGNGSAMRVSPVGFAFSSMEEVLEQAEKSASATHNHPEGIKGAQATALAVYLARNGKDKETIREEITQRFGYALDRTVETIRPDYRFDVSCQGSVPQAIIAFLDSENYEDAVRKAVSLGGDSDTQACIAGGIAQAYYRYIPESIIRQVHGILPEPLLSVLQEFTERIGSYY